MTREDAYVAKCYLERISTIEDALYNYEERDFSVNITIGNSDTVPISSECESEIIEVIKREKARLEALIEEL